MSDYNSLFTNMETIDEDTNAGDIALGMIIANAADKSSKQAEEDFKKRKEELKGLIKKYAGKFKITVTPHLTITHRALDLRDKAADNVALYDVIYNNSNKDTIHANLRMLCRMVNDEATTIMDDISIYDNSKANRFAILYSGGPIYRAWTKSHT